MTNKFIKKILENSDKYVIFYSDWCGYSIKAIELLKQLEIPFKGYIIEDIGGMNKLLSSLIQKHKKINFDPNHKTRPIIFNKGVFLGGYSELQSLINK